MRWACRTRPHSLQQPRRRRQRRDDHRQHAAVEGRRAHFTHLQFHGYGTTPEGGWCSGGRELIEYINAHPEVTGDVGQVMFGPATTLTADGPVEYLLRKSSGRKWVNVDIELETGCGIVPYTYKEKAAVAALQWAVGLELFLLSADPWRVVLSTDHPNGGSFMAYPELIRLLMDRAYRDDRLQRVNQKLLAGSALLDGIAREYTLNEIAIITRAAPARILGLTKKGHLGDRRGCRRHRVRDRSRRVADVRDAALTS
jgi:formylmethanofuran dehydrogenase subunit A